MTELVPQAPPRSRRARLLLLLVAALLGVPAGFLFAHAVRVPAVRKLIDYQPAIITRIYDRNGLPFAEYSIQRRIVVPKREMSQNFVNAVVATEDADFYKHGGVDPKAIIRAAIKDVIERRRAQGASTLTQQLAKQVFLTPEKTLRRKINEVFLAVQIEKDFTKDQIFELYANQVYLGHGAYGIEAASRLYFGKHAKDLSIAEGATIAALIRSPMFYSPISHPDRAKMRRDYVLSRELKEGFITRQQYQQAVSTPLILGTYKEEAPRVGAYFAEEIRQYIEKNEKFGVENLYQRGLKVYSTLDLRMQQAAEIALQRGLRRFDKRRGFRKPSRNLVAEGLDPETWRDPSWSSEPYTVDRLYPAVVLAVGKDRVTVRVNRDRIDLDPESWKWTTKKTLDGVVKRGDLVYVLQSENEKTKARKWMLDQMPVVQGAIVAIDVKSGEIRALVGGYDFQMSKFNRAVQSRRQTGSSFKPFVYGAAFEKGLTPADTLFDAPIAIPVGNQTYAPKNYYGKYAGIVTIQRALELSINVPAVKTYMMAGGDRVVDFARRCGITSDLPKYPSLALGAAGVSPVEMTAAYNVFINNGVYVKPRYIRKIADQTERALDEPLSELSEATSPQVAFELAYMLKGVIDRGTGYAAHTLAPPLAGKTGTTNGYTDAWFIGFTPEYTIGVWTGYDDPSKSLGGGATGAEVALPIWIDVEKQLETLKLRTPKPEFEPPAGVVVVPMDLYSGRRGAGPCSRVVNQAFVAGQEPDKDCSGASVEVSKLPYYLQRPFYQPKEAEPTQAANDASARTGEGAESPAPNTDTSGH
ncbi:MAG: PBP1A family penicillin-binding protein [Acidobacteria bacterium]|nr:PBP1A family penicillin-binding protein [Acidobacteriota bacterium]MBV9474522.1 PBP1A family penicillin-binding protein [Acidobacteriota bacterium]